MSFQKTLMRGVTGAALLLAADGLIASGALAQIDEIIVTARKREESLQDVPISVTAFDQKRIDQIAAKTLRDFDGLIPNVQLGQTTAAAQGGAITFRGQGYADVEKTQNPPVGVIVDGLFLGTNTGQLIDAFDIERIEFLRGPQGVLFGKNTTGGVINVKRSQPTGEWGVKGTASYGSFDEAVVRGLVNAPIVEDKLALKVGATLRQRDGYYDNLSTGDDIGDVDYNAITGSLLFTPIEDLEILFTYDRIRDKSDIQPNDSLFLDNLSGNSLSDGVTNLNPFKTASNFNVPFEFEVDQFILEGNWDTPVGTFTSITAYVDSNDVVFQDFDAGDESVFNLPFKRLHTIRDQSYEQFTQELRLNGDVFEDRLNYTLGFYYYDHEIELFQNTDQITVLRPELLGLGSCAAGLLPVDPLAPSAPIPFVAPSGEFCQLANNIDQVSGEENDAIAFFGSLDFKVTEKLTLSLGARHTSEDKESPGSVFASNVVPGLAQTVAAAETGIDQTTYKIGLDYQVTDDILAFFSYTDGGFRSGGISIRAVIPEHQIYGPETVDHYEGGFKTEFFDNRLRLNVAGFFTEVEGEQFNTVLQGAAFLPGTSTLINNIESTDIWGAEAEFTAQVHEFVQLRGSFGWLDFERQGSLPCERVANVGTASCPVAGTPLSFDGSDRTRSPEFTYAIGSVVTYPIGPGELIGSLDWKYQDDHFLVVSSTGGEQVLQEGYGLLDVNLTYAFDFKDSNLKVSFQGKNLTDKEYLVNALSFGGVDPLAAIAGGSPQLGIGGTGFAGFGAPRTFVGQISVEF